ncbi:hypothetical protein OH77DRAFT_1524436 [Trametes cingulata]|nr:hypothetical protein OH77DRAFT_1524436 [Trametes cingulata]
MLVRLNWWTKSGELPTSTMVQKDERTHTVRFAEAVSLVGAAANGLDAEVEVWTLAIAGWRILPLRTAEVCLANGEEVVLVRLLGVEQCSNFGVELEMLYQCLHLPAPLNLPEVDLRLPAAQGPFARVVVWQLESIGPIAFLVPLNAKRLLRLNRFPEIRQHATDDDFSRAHVWSFATTTWTPKKIDDDIELPANLDTLLVKKLDVYATIGLGKTIETVERALAAATRVEDVPGDIAGDHAPKEAERSNISEVIDDDSPQASVAINHAQAQQPADDCQHMHGDGQCPSDPREQSDLVLGDVAGSGSVIEGDSLKDSRFRRRGFAEARARDDTAVAGQAAAGSYDSPKRLKADAAGKEGRDEPSGGDNAGSAERACVVASPASQKTHDGDADMAGCDVHSVAGTEAVIAESLGDYGAVKESDAHEEAAEAREPADTEAAKKPVADEAGGEAVGCAKGGSVDASFGEGAARKDTEVDVDAGLAAEPADMNVTVGLGAVADADGDERGAAVELGAMAAVDLEQAAAAVAGENYEAHAGSEAGRAGEGQVENDDEDGSASGSDTAVDGVSEPDDGVAAESDDVWRPFWVTTERGECLDLTIGESAENPIVVDRP